MSLKEIVHRCFRLVRYGYDAFMYRRGWVSKSGVNVNAAHVQLFDKRNSIRSGDRSVPENLNQYRSLWLENTVQLFDPGKQYPLGQPVQWLVDPATRIKTPMKFGRSIDYRDDQTVGEIKYLWEVGRHQFLVPMAICVASDKDEVLKARLESHLSTWMEQNPVGMGIHWCSSLELALRLISWSFIHSILQSGGMKNGLFDLNCDAEQLGVHIRSQVAFIVGNYSRYSSSNNHLIGELTGVWMTCNVFDLGGNGIRWRESAYAELNNEIQLQTHDDGVNKEQAVYYHLWSLEYFWLVWSVAKRYEYAVTPAFEEQLLNMIVFLQAMCTQTNMPSQIGDADGGVVARFNPDISDNVYESLLASISQALGRENVSSPVSTDKYSKAYWYALISSQSDISSMIERYKKTRVKSARNTVFKSGGYYKLQGEKSHLLYKAGPFGYLSTGAHGHADALSVTLAIDGNWWLVDPGTYTYHSSAEWRNYFRGTAAHNTLCVNQSDQSEIAGDFLWSRKTDAHVQDIEMNDHLSPSCIASVTGSHSGYADQGVEHERTVKSDGAHRFEIHDLIVLQDQAEACDLQLSFHFHPDVMLKQLDTHRWLATRQDSPMSLTLELPEHFSWDVKNGAHRPIAGWYSETYGVKTPSNALLGRTLLSKEHRLNSNRYRTSLIVHDSDGYLVTNGVSR